MSKKMSEELQRRLSNALDRQLKGIVVNAKLAEDATCGDCWKEVLAWLGNAQTCLNEASQLALELKGGGS